MRQFRAAILAPALALVLAGCGATDRQSPAPAESLVPPPSASTAPAATLPAGDECGASLLGSYLGKVPSVEAMAAISAAVGHDRFRTIRPGDAVTMDYRAERLNIELGEDGRITRMRCG
jgi:hypothetical protein